MGELLGTILCISLASGWLDGGTCYQLAHGLTQVQGSFEHEITLEMEDRGQIDPALLASEGAIETLQPGDNPVNLTAGASQLLALEPTEPGFYLIETVDLPGDFDPILGRYDPVTGELIEEDDDGGEGYASRLTIQAATNEQFLFRVAELSGQRGTFAVRVANVAVKNVQLGNNPIELMDNTPRLFEFQPTEPGLYRVETATFPESFDLFLSHQDPATGAAIAEDDDSGEGYGARLYVNALGGQRLLFQVAELGGQSGLIEIQVSKVDPETLQLDDGMNNTGNQHIGAGGSHWYRLMLSANRHYTFSTGELSGDVDTTLELLDADFHSLVYDDDGGEENLSSRISWIVPVGMEGFLKVSNIAEVAGSFTLSVAAQPLDILDLTPGSLADQTLEGYGQVFYRLSAEAGERYSITTRNLSNELDTVLRILDPSATTVLVEDDDGGQGYGSHLEWTAPAAGEYWVQISNIAAPDGTFELWVGGESPPPASKNK